MAAGVVVARSACVQGKVDHACRCSWHAYLRQMASPWTRCGCGVLFHWGSLLTMISFDAP